MLGTPLSLYLVVRVFTLLACHSANACLCFILLSMDIDVITFMYLMHIICTSME